jgi:V/A-type H+/Na+-transporting ATPase subunit E
MALDSVTKDIVASANSKISAINAERDAEISKIEAEAAAAISGMKEKEDKKLAEAIERLDRQEISSAELESKKTVLAKKKEILAEAFEGTLTKLETAPRDVKLAQYKKMVKSAKTVISKPTAFMAEDDDFTAKELGVVAVEKDRRIKGGLVLQSEDGFIEVDMQYRTILQNIWDGDLKNLSDILFG